jgi:hypothetical protein
LNNEQTGLQLRYNPCVLEISMSVTAERVEVTTRGRHPYFKFLKTVFPLPTVIERTDTEPAMHLQSLIDDGDSVEYDKQVLLYKAEGHTMRTTDMVVYEDFKPEDIPSHLRRKGDKDTIDVRVAVQVKGHSINWYFWVKDGKDRYPQEFRDILYSSASRAHEHVGRGCDLYYRGSNAFHVKTMHTKEAEAGHNHNHYRMRDNQPVRALDFREHMMALKGTEAFTQGFFEEGEIEAIIEDFEQHELMWTFKGDEGLEPSAEEIYMARPENKLNAADVVEFRMFGEQQEPCRSSVTELTMDFDNARKLIEERFIPKDGKISELAKLEMQLQIAKMTEEFKVIMDFRAIGGSKGLGSERAMTRQVEGSEFDTIDTVVKKDDDIGGAPKIPKWAITALREVEIARGRVEEMADLDDVATVTPRVFSGSRETLFRAPSTPPPTTDDATLLDEKKEGVDSVADGKKEQSGPP